MRDGPGQTKGQARSPEGRLCPHLAAVIDNGLAREGKAQADPRRLARGCERLEDPTANFRRDPWAGVTYLNQNRVGFSDRANVDGSSTGHDFQRIHQQINEYSMDAIELH